MTRIVTPSSASASAPAGSPRPRAADQNDELTARCRREWAASQAVRDEFLTVEGYIGYQRAAARGAIRIYGRQL